ncbi:LOW QUALITY PROTEIN: uncharacterized protein [Panulirus ornatus]|uniref:LOW QUALITY PROTEIN: uncharacterized protein n=1 Tax=Panulirus ornatus TaxID=150431 RepID=UPI003A846E1D
MNSSVDTDKVVRGWRCCFLWSGVAPRMDEIGETIHSGPTLVAQEKLKDEDVAVKSNCVFPGDTQENTCVLRKSCHQSEIPSTRHCSPQLPTSPCPTGQPQPEPHLWHTHCDVGAKVQLKASLPAALVPEAIVPEIIVPKISDLEATVPHVIVTQTVAPEAPIAEAAVPELLVNKATVPELILNEAAVPEVTVNKPAVLQDKVTETALPETAVNETAPPETALNETAIPNDKITELHNPEVSVNEATYKITTVETNVLEIEYNEGHQDKVNEGGIPKEKQNKTTLLTDKENEAAVPAIILNEGISHQNKKREAAIHKLNVNETATPGAPSNEAILPEVSRSEADLPEAFEIKAVVTDVAEAIGTEHTTATPNLSVSVAAVLEDLPLGTTPAHQASLPVVTQENREMVRLIQEADAKLDSFCPKRSSRASKRLSSADFEAVEIKSEPVSRAKKCTRTRKSSCRSDKSESETSDSRSVADESLYFDMVDKTTKRGKPKNGEPLLDEAATHISAKYNGDVSSELVNGAHKVKGRRISRANSDESDCSSASRSNGNVDHNSEKLDFSLLLEISPADRKKFESKKAKIRRKTADWQLISETERYYNEKEEIMRNKNKLESDSDNDESDDGTENQDSKSDCSDESEGMANPPRVRGKGKCKHSRTVDDDDSKPTAKRIKDDPCVSKKRGRPIGSRNRKTRYDLTMLNDDDDDDNFFGFPVSTTIPQTTQSSSAVSSSSTQTRGKAKEGNKSTPEASSSSGKSGRKRLSDAERFLRDNREYYHFQETPERLRRSTSSSADKEKAPKVDESEGKESDKKEETKLKDTSSAKKQPTAEGRRRVTRSTGGTLEDAEAEERDEAKIVEKDEIKDVVKVDSKNTEKGEAKDKERDKRKVSVEDKKKICSENKRKILEDNKKAFEDDKKKANEDKRNATEDEVKKTTEDEKKKVAEEDRGKVAEEDKRKISEEDKSKVTEDNRNIAEEKRKVTEESKRKVTEDDKRKVTEEDKRKVTEADKRNVTEESKTKDSDEVRRMTSEADRRKVTEEGKKISEEEKKRITEEGKKNISEENKVKDIEVSKKIGLEVDKKKTGLDDKISCEDDHVNKQHLNLKTKVPSDSESLENTGKGNVVEILENKDGSRSVLQDLYFSFEGVPVQESWYQTYQRLIDGIDINEFAYEEEPLKFVLPYEMPKEYVRDFLCYKKGMLSKKKNDLADLVRKSPRCHASTLALFSDIIPTKKVKGAKVTRSVPVKVDEASSDGTSTPGAESTRMQPPECFESAEELAILALHIDHFMKSESCSEELPICNPLLDELKESEEPDFKKTPPKKRGKKKKLLGGSKCDKGSQENIAKELKLFESPLAHEVDPVFIAGLCDEVKDYLTPENILAREASEVIEDSCFCVCTDRASCDEFSSADDNTEASSECVSLCDSETVDGSVISEPKRCRSGKKRRKNLTGWPKAQKKKKPVPSHTSDDNDSAIGCDDLEPKKQGHWKKHDDFSLLEQTTTQKLAALAACDRRASPRKKASVLYMDTWPVRYRTQK